MIRCKVRKNLLPGIFTLLAAGMLTAAMTGLVAPASLAAQTGAITGTISNSNSGAPLSAAQVSVQGTGLGSLTQPNGKFLILNVPAGTYTVEAVLIGYANATMKVTVASGQSAVADIKMVPQAVSLSEIVVTGVAGATQRAKLPFDVSKVNAQNLPVPQPTVAGQLAGKVAGVAVVAGNSRPGVAPDIMLRGPTSIESSGRSEEPLYIVDGVILGSGLVDLDALDIASVEIVKGAAAASLYGSRAANGVIQITTKRGTSMANDVVHYTVRSQWGQNHLGPTPSAYLAKYMPYLTDSNGLFIDSKGNHCVYLLCKNALTNANNASWYDATYDAANNIGSQWTTVNSIPWPGKTYDQVQRFFVPALNAQNYASADGRSGTTNFHVSLSNLSDGAVMPGDLPYNRTNLRVNVDQAVSEKVQVQASGMYARSKGPTSNGDLHALTRIPAGTDLLAPDPNDSTHYVVKADPNNTEATNPIYENEQYTNEQDRGRFLGSLNVRYSPTTWVDIDANGSYDRSDVDDVTGYPKGYATTTKQSRVNNGSLSASRGRDESSNASITGTIRRDLSDNTHSTTTLRYLYEDDESNNYSANGYDYAVGGVPTLSNVDQSTVRASSDLESIKADGYFIDEALDINSRYEIDALARNDGSSLFGSAERRQWYYRVAGAWRLTQEPWFHINGLNELKLRYSLGTAGSRPRFNAQYETYNVSGGIVTPVNKGNKNLKPEFSVEQEAGIDAALWDNRVTVNLTYAHTNTTDQMLQVPLPAYTGYQTQWQNAGTLTNNSYEATVNVDLIQTDNLDWSVKGLFSKNTSVITALSAPPYVAGVGGQGLGSIFYFRPGENYGTFYGYKAARSCADLPVDVQTNCSEFVKNNDGFLVWVGNGGSLSDNKWGTMSDVKVRGATVPWGTVIEGECTDRLTGERTTYCKVGQSLPNYDLNFQTNLRWKGINVYALVEHSSGFDVYNQSLQWAVFASTAGIFDQAGIPPAQQKPLQYFLDEYSNLGGLVPSDVFVEDGTFTKLKEVSVSYRFDAKQLAGVPGLEHFSAIGLSLDGTNLLKWTNYRGFDPEVGRSGGDTGSAALARVESYEFPPFRTFTGSIELIF
jgi:TonB-linked SusC/RagA family outer membrane protein